MLLFTGQLCSPRQRCCVTRARSLYLGAHPGTRKGTALRDVMCMLPSNLLALSNVCFNLTMQLCCFCDHQLGVWSACGLQEPHPAPIWHSTAYSWCCCSSWRENHHRCCVGASGHGGHWWLWVRAAGITRNRMYAVPCLCCAVVVRVHIGHTHVAAAGSCCRPAWRMQRTFKQCCHQR